MKKAIILSLSAAALVAAGVAQAQQGNFRERLAERLAAKRNARGDIPTAPGKQTLAYGRDRLQKLDFYPAQNAKGPAPLVLFVHGGGWQRGSKDNAGSRWAPVHFPQAGYA